MKSFGVQKKRHRKKENNRMNENGEAKNEGTDFYVKFAVLISVPRLGLVLINFALSLLMNCQSVITKKVVN